MYYFARLDDNGELSAVAEWLNPVPPERVRGKENGLYYATPALVRAFGKDEGEVAWKFLDEAQTIIGLASEMLD
jgi:hypothetical protein